FLSFLADVASCVLLLSLSWRTSEALPVPAPSRGPAVSIYLTDGIQSEKIEMRSTGDTVLACAPTLTQVSLFPKQHSLWQQLSASECLKNIKMDLLYYHEAIASYLRGPLKNGPEEIRLLSPIVEITKNLTEDDKWGNDSYSNRLEMNKMMKGFHIRAITINRAIGYISSGDHRK
uniref:Interleukin 12a n=1 Tax=Oreochromis niloticus TaxID=8128 RepID=A0A669BNC6_ORENI